MKKTDEYRVGEYYKCECGKCFNKPLSLSAHFRHCIEHHKTLGYDVVEPPKGCMCGWDNKSHSEISSIYQRAHDTRKERHYVGTFRGRVHTEATKLKMRESMIRFKEKNCGGCVANASLKQCIYLDKLSKEKNWNLQHARNGGEFRVLGYFVDGYDREKNIVVEYDERFHYVDVNHNTLRERDIRRQENIIRELGCRFLRYNEVTQQLYEVNI